MTAGLRERKKRETRQAISDVATMLFLERGFDQVTIAEVAQAAGVSKMTVTNYFPRKEDLIFDRADAIIASLAQAVAERAAGESMLAAVRRSFAESVRQADVTLGLAGQAFARLVQGSPVLASRGLEVMDQRERALGDAIAAELGTDTVQQRLVAALLASVHRVVTAEGWRAQPGRRAPGRRSWPRWPPRPRPALTGWSPRWATTASGPPRPPTQQPRTQNRAPWPPAQAKPTSEVGSGSARSAPMAMASSRIRSASSWVRGGLRFTYSRIRCRHSVNASARPLRRSRSAVSFSCRRRSSSVQGHDARPSPPPLQAM